MTFEPAQPEIPAAIGDMEHVITEYVGLDDEGNPRVPTITYSVQVLDQSGNVMQVLTGDEQPHLTQAQIDGLLAFIAAQRAKAVAEILG